MQALYEIEAPDALALSVTLDDGSHLELQTAVRVVPQKRIVALGEWQRQTVYIKLFMGESADRHAKRDANGVNALISAGIQTPALLFNGAVLAQPTTTSPDTIRVLILKAYTAAENAEDVYQRANGPLKKALATKLIKTVASHHKADLLQTDLYFKNFLIDQGAVLTIDGDGIRSFEKLTDNQKKENLARLLSKMDVLDLARWLPEMIHAYDASLNTPIEENALLKLVNQLRIKAASDYADKKVFRQCTDVVVKQNAYEYLATRRDYVDLPLPANSREYDEALEGGQWLKKGNTCSVGFVQIGPLPVVVKRYNIKSLSHALSRIWRPSRASRSWASAHRLLNLGLATPQPIALYEKRIAKWGRGQAYFVTRYLDAPDVGEFFALAKKPELRASAVKQVVELLLRLNELQISHGDFKATNIKVMPDGKPVLIDLDSMQQHRCRFFAQKAHAKDLKRFMQNWKGEQALYNAFLKSFKVIYQDHAPLAAAGLVELPKE